MFFYVRIMLTALLSCCAFTVSLADKIELVHVGNTGNGNTWINGAGGGALGAVNYEYAIGKNEVTSGQYTEFLNAVAATDTYGLYNTNMAILCGITRSGTSGSYTYSVSDNFKNRPVSYVSWGDAARFANWLHNGCPEGAQDLSTTEDGAYYLNGAVTDTALMAVSRESDWKWALATDSEWYKAGYHQNNGDTSDYYNFPSSSNTAPAMAKTISGFPDAMTDPSNSANYGGVYSGVRYIESSELENSSSPYGTFNQGGNVGEWTEGVYSSARSLLGGYYNSTVSTPLGQTKYTYAPTTENSSTGFRVVNAVVNVVAYGADPAGNSDSTLAIMTAHATGYRVFYPNGSYRFNNFSGQTPDFSGGILFESISGVLVRNYMIDYPIFNFDHKGNFIGMQQNNLQQDNNNLGGYYPFHSGNILTPPVSDAQYNTQVDILTHWYNDFGLEYRRLDPVTGWVGWYYWTWNFYRSSDGYDKSRHPLLGFYKGDEPNVLDWQCYWLREFGIHGVILHRRANVTSSFSNWSNPADNNYWLWQLFNNVPNFAGLKYIIYGPTPYMAYTQENQDAVEATWEDVIDNIYFAHSNFYSIEYNNETYPVIYLLEEPALRGVFDNYNGSSQLVAFYGRIADRFQAQGYGGVALFARKLIPDSLINDTLLKTMGVLRYKAFYGEMNCTGYTYADRLNDFLSSQPTDSNTIINICTSHHSDPSHPSAWVCPGNTPALFQQFVQKAIYHITQNSMLPIVTCYSIDEWAEGGPGLQPNMQDGFGYLQAVLDENTVP